MKCFVAGGAGGIGHRLTERLLELGHEVLVYDNFSSGKMDYLEKVLDNPDLIIVEADIEDTKNLIRHMRGMDIVYHLASNPDISKATEDPTIDFWQGTYLTQCILEAMRITGVKKIVYASGSGVYGDKGYEEVKEDNCLEAISPYAASKIAGEALISAYCHMFDMRGEIYRFANVIGKHQTHGVIRDFILKLKNNPKELEIWGNGEQSKSYIFVDDVIYPILLSKDMFDEYKKVKIFNVATNDYIEVKEIAELVKKAMKLDDAQIKYVDGFKGDVPIVRFNSNKIRAWGWKNKYTTKEAVEITIDLLLKELL